MRSSPLAIAAAICMAAPAGAGTPVLPDLERVIDAGKLVVEMSSDDVDPAVSTDATGGARGFDVDLARALAGELGVEVEFRRKARTPDQVIAAVARGEADIGMGLLSATADRAKHVLFTRPYAHQGVTALVNRKRALRFRGRCPTGAEVRAAALQPGQVGVQKQGAAALWLRERLPDARALQYAGLAHLFEAGRRGEVLLTIQGEIPARRLLYAHPDAAIQLRLCMLDTRPDHVAVAVRPDAPGLVRWIDAFLQERSVFYDAEVLGRYEGPWTFKMGESPRR